MNQETDRLNAELKATIEEKQKIFDESQKKNTAEKTKKVSLVLKNQTLK